VTTAFVLSGGASLGAAQVGMLAALSDAGVRPDLIIGTSVGAINGAWVAGGSDCAGLGAVWRSLRRDTVFPARPFDGVLGFAGRREHLVPDTGIRRLLRDHVRFEQMQDAQVPFHVVATDVLSGCDTLLSHGNAVDAILASAAIPGVLPPVRVAGRDLMDGGVVNNTPISHAVRLGADVIWVLATGYSCALTQRPRGALGMALHAVTLGINRRLAADIRRYARQVDLRVAPPLCPIRTSAADFTQAAELIDRAHQLTRDWLAAGARHLPLAAAKLEPHGHATGAAAEAPISRSPVIRPRSSAETTVPGPSQASG
jgi:NTE family protein